MNYPLYLGDWFNYESLSVSFFVSALIAIIMVYIYLIRVAFSAITGLLSALVLLGVTPGILAYSALDDPSTPYFYFCYVFPIMFLMVFSRYKIGTSFTGHFAEKTSVKNIYSLRIIPVQILLLISFMLLLYFIIKNYSVLSWSGLDDVYTQRALSKDRFGAVEKYLYLFMKYVGGGLSIVLSIYLKKYLYYIFFLLIFLFDYFLGAHKFSIGIILFVTSYIVYLKYLSKYLGGDSLFFFYTAFGISLLFSILITLFKSVASIAPYLIATYDRVFFVTVGIFARNYDYVTINGFFYGGSSIMGRLLGSEPRDVYYVIGEEYWSKGVMANTDIISDGFINFGYLGVIVTVFIFWLSLNKVDDRVYLTSIRCLYPLTVLYSISAIFSLGFSIALLSGGLFFYFILIKCLFKKEL
jgi:hypothetical protein